MKTLEEAAIALYMAGRWELPHDRLDPTKMILIKQSYGKIYAMHWTFQKVRQRMRGSW